MRILVTGRGTSGSFRIRGEQLGKAIGATVAPNATAEQIAEADLVIVIKRADTALVERIHTARKPLVFDCLDSWPQPHGNAWSRETAIREMRDRCAAMRPHAIVTATHRMQEDLADNETPIFALHHHARPGLVQNPIREKVAKVGYEGAALYLGQWKEVIERQCKARGWQFVINPAHLADLDIVIALRGGKYDGYQPRAWKSNVKLANAQASGTPFIGAPECGYQETSSGAEYWVRSEKDIAFAFEWLTEHAARKAASERLAKFTPTLENIATKYKQFLRRLC